MHAFVQNYCMYPMFPYLNVSLNGKPNERIFAKKLMIDQTVFYAVIIALLFAGFTAYLIFLQKKAAPTKMGASSESTLQLQLQAYERLTLLVERIALPNLIQRVYQPGLTAVEWQLLLTKTLREEFEYNITQQVYVSPDAWKAVKSLKEKNLLIINQAANTLSSESSGMDLNKKILAFLAEDTAGKLHDTVSEILSYEAKQLL